MNDNNWDVAVIYAAILAGVVLLMYMFINLIIDTV
jgi:hypothetical protein